MSRVSPLRSIALIGWLLTAALVFAACGPAEPAATVADPAAPAAEPAAATTADEDVVMSRGAADLLRILYWQAPTILNPHLAAGTKDFDASRLILEPLAGIAGDGSLVPLLVAEIPTLENGGVAEDLSSITWTLREDLLWSDGTPVTSEDVVFTYEYCADSGTACVTVRNFQGIESVEALDDRTVRVNWEAPTVDYYKTFTSQNGRIIQKAQFGECIGEAASTAEACQAANMAPIGTGPYVLTEFRPGDVVMYAANENYRDADKPFFKEVQFKGGGDAVSAARAVFQTDDTDWAWNLQVEAAVLDQLVSTGGTGDVVVYSVANVERLLVNFTNPDPALGDERGQLSQPHPFLTDFSVRQALALAIDRAAISDQLYGATGFPTCTLLWYEPYASDVDDFYGDNCLQDIDEANRLLDEAGWERGSDGVRARDGVRLSILFQTSTNTLRQKTQELIKQWWEEIGVETELKNVDAGVYFGTGNADDTGHFFADIQMYTTGSSDPSPIAHLCQWTSDQAAQSENEWRGGNNMRWQNEEMDALCAEAQEATDLDRLNELASQIDQVMTGEYAQIPLVARPRVAGASLRLRGYEPSAWDSELWNIANWYVVE
jgi:peptide/nickel transport system substrate-binding protein